jgi:hypothetical protein
MHETSQWHPHTGYRIFAPGASYHVCAGTAKNDDATEVIHYLWLTCALVHSTAIILYIFLGLIAIISSVLSPFTSIKRTRITARPIVKCKPAVELVADLTPPGLAQNACSKNESPNHDADLQSIVFARMRAHGVRHGYVSESCKHFEQKAFEMPSLIE